MQSTILGFGLIIAVVGVFIFSLLQWLGVAVGTFTDWVVGVCVLEWFLILTTVPWNIHFEAKEALAEAARSQHEGIAIRQQDTVYAQKLADRFLILALGLHGISAVALYALAASGISNVGYLAAAGALLLTALRPALRGYEYIKLRLVAIKEIVRYPREDVHELRQRVAALESWRPSQEKQLIDVINQQAEQNRSWQEEQARLNALLREYNADNQQAHERLSRESRSAIAQLSADSQFLDQVREIIRFFKSA